MLRSASPIAICPGSNVLGQFARSLISIVKAFKDRQEVMNLAELDERMLKDIGLTRRDVDGALAQPLHHNPSRVLVRCLGDAAKAQASEPNGVRKARPVVAIVSRI